MNTEKQKIKWKCGKNRHFDLPPLFTHCPLLCKNFLPDFIRLFSTFVNTPDSLKRFFMQSVERRLLQKP